MKKALSLLLAGVMCVGLLAGCGGQNTEDPQGSGSTPDTSDTQETGNKTIDTLRIAFVPSREPDEIITATEPLKQMLTDELAKLGYDVGEVDITVGTSYEAVGEALSAGSEREDVARVTFPEGLSLREIADLLEEKGVCPADEFLDYLDTADLSQYDFVAELPDDDRYHRLEGYIFPDTYDFYLGEAPASVATRFLDRFEQIVDQEIRDRAEEMGMTIDEVVTLASVIQAECSYPSEMANVSGVFHNRLNDPANYPKLQSDVTVFYIRDEILPYAGSDTEDFYDQLYNTYVHNGLPVGPICSPGEDALKAALYPAEHDYYYFITDKDGNFLYAQTLAEHEANIRDAGI